MYYSVLQVLQYTVLQRSTGIIVYYSVLQVFQCTTVCYMYYSTVYYRYYSTVYYSVVQVLQYTVVQYSTGRKDEKQKTAQLKTGEDNQGNRQQTN